MTKSINLNNKKINSWTRPYVIAEIGVNHGGSMDSAKQLICEAKKGELMLQNFKATKLLHWHLKIHRITGTPQKNQ